MVRFEIFEKLICVRKSKIWMRFWLFDRNFELLGKILEKKCFWEYRSDFRSVFHFRFWAKTPSKQPQSGFKKSWGGSLIFSLQPWRGLGPTCCVKSWDKVISKMAKSDFFENVIWIDQWKFSMEKLKIFDFLEEDLSWREWWI